MDKMMIYGRRSSEPMVANSVSSQQDVAENINLKSDSSTITRARCATLPGSQSFSADNLKLKFWRLSTSDGYGLLESKGKNNLLKTVHPKLSGR
jgi:hypothetical protein